MRKQRIVLHTNLRDPANVKTAYFYADDSAAVQYAMPYDDWVDMGKPAIITVTVRPGDRLNV